MSCARSYGSLLVVGLAVGLLTAPPAQATKFRKPFNGGASLGHGFDNNFGAGGCTDYACAGKCYDTHSGSDFPMVTGTEVVAGANGTVSAVVQGCSNTGYRGNPCGSYCGNHVKLAHPDGSTTIYCHMKNGSIVVGQGQGVSCGQKLGLSASSGSSTGPHLHFGWRPGGSYLDPYSGGCSSGGGAWVSQGPYNGAPGTGCETQCQCSPGQQQSQGCGNCGTQTRTCNGSCQWGGWSGCQGQGACAAGQGQTQGCGNCGTQTRSCKSNCQWTGWTGCAGEGACAPGTVQEEACCDCGARSRTCGGDCGWPAWSECDGPDPEPPVTCLTGQLGVCGTGDVQCVTGCLACVDVHFPSEEVCDDLDNDCDGPVDEDADELGPVGPRYGAELVDLSAPAALRPGEQALVWLTARNVGTDEWPAHETWVAAETQDGAANPLWDPEAWSAHDVAAVVEQPVAPGQVATLAFPVRMPGAAPPTVTAEFALAVRGQTLRCPLPSFQVVATRLAPLALAAPPETGSAPGSAATGSPGGPTDGQPDAGSGSSSATVDAAAGAETSGPSVSAPVTETATSHQQGAGGCGAGLAPSWWALLGLLLVDPRRLVRPRRASERRPA